MLKFSFKRYEIYNFKILNIHSLALSFMPSLLMVSGQCLDNNNNNNNNEWRKGL